MRSPDVHAPSLEPGLVSRWLARLGAVAHPLLRRARLLPQARHVVARMGGASRPAAVCRELVSLVLDPPGSHDVASIPLEGADFHVDASEEIGRKLVYRLGAFERFELDLFAAIVRANDVVLDVGANLGLYTRAAIRRGAEVHAFEPNPAVRPLLEKNVRAVAADRAWVHPYALGAACGTIAFNRSSDSAYASVVDTRRKAIVERIDVPLTTIDAFLRERRLVTVDVVKIDVEGYEEEVLTGAADLLRRADAPIVLVEIATRNLSPRGRSQRDVLDALAAQGFELRAAVEGLPLVRDLPPPTIAELENFLGVKPARAARVASRLRGRS